MRIVEMALPNDWEFSDFLEVADDVDLRALEDEYLEWKHNTDEPWEDFDEWLIARGHGTRWEPEHFVRRW